MALETHYIQQKMQERFGLNAQNFQTQRDIFSFEVNQDISHEAIRFLKEENDLNFHFLTDLCGVHYPDNPQEKQFAVVYLLHNWVENVRIRVKVFLSAENPEIKSIVDLFLTANWMERETYDFYGINFKNHPQLKRILNMEEMASFPMRKEFPMEDQGRTDKDDRFFGRTPAKCN